MQGKALGWIVAILGGLVALVSALADQIGIGKTGFGPNQVTGTFAGVVILGVGLFLLARKRPDVP